MEMPKRVLCIMDLSIVGRASLSATPCVLAACGVQCCPFPASLLSTHTGGFTGVQVLDLSEFGLRALGHIVAEGTHFDAVYIGYLNSPGQFRLAEKALESYPGSYKIVDPAMGDEGALYSGITEETVAGMQALCQKADLITPNFTESALLAGEDAATWTPERLQGRLASLAGGGATVLVTSVPATDGGMEMLGYLPAENLRFTLGVHMQPQSYPGTGDLFTAGLAGLMLAGLPLEQAAGASARFIEESIKNTAAKGSAVRQGAWFEPCLPILSRASGVCAYE